MEDILRILKLPLCVIMDIRDLALLQGLVRLQVTGMKEWQNADKVNNLMLENNIEIIHTLLINLFIIIAAATAEFPAISLAKSYFFLTNKTVYH